MFGYNIFFVNFRALKLPPDDNVKYEKTLNGSIENARIYREQLNAQEALKNSRTILLKFMNEYE